MKSTHQMRQKVLSLLLGLSLLFNIFAPLTAVYAQDVAPPDAPVTSWQLTDSENQVVSETHPVKSGASYALTAEVHLQALEGGKLVAGSSYQVKLPVNAETGTWSGEELTPKDLVNKLGEVIGTFVIKDQVIILTLNETVTELEQVDAIIQTDAVLTTDVDKDVTQSVQVGDSSQNIVFVAAAEVTPEPVTTPETTPAPESKPEPKPALKAKPAPRAVPVDYSSQVVVNDWDILDSNGTPLSTLNPVTSGRYQLKFSWTLSPIGATLNAGDTFSFDRPTISPSGSTSATDFAWVNFTDENGIVLGQWRINNDKIEVELGANAAGLQSISAEFVSGMTAFYVSAGNQSGTFDVSFGDITKQITFKSASMTILSSNDYKTLNSVSNHSVGWGIFVGRSELKGLGASSGAAYDYQGNVYVEDGLQGTPSSVSLHSQVFIPMDLVSGVLSGSSGAIVNIPITQITQNPGETYEDFKARLGVYQYGFYQDDYGMYSFVLYLGNLGSEGTRYADLNTRFASVAATQAINNGFYQESDRAALEAYFINTYGNGNVIGGKIASYLMIINETYPQVATETVIRNTARITKNGISKDFSATGKLQVPGGGGTTVTAGSAGLILADTDSNLPLSGTFKLQQKQADNSWLDYNNGATYTTVVANAGFVDAGTVGNGTYRFVQVTAPNAEYDLEHSPGYDTGLGTVVSEAFDVTSTAGQVVTIKNTKYKFNVTYSPGPSSGPGNFTAEVYNGRVINSMTPSFVGNPEAPGQPLGKPGYTFTGWSPAVADTVTATVTYIAQWRANVYNIDYVLNGGSPTSNPATYTYGVGVDDFAPATGKTGHTFAGWYDAETAGNPVTTISATDIGDKTLYARWTANQYDINYHLDNGTNTSTNPTKYTYGVGVTSFENATKTGYNFLGWYDAAEGGNLITSIATDATGTKDLYAHWDYTITYDLDGGTNGDNPTHYEFGTGVASFAPASKEGYVFQGWYTAATNGQKVESIAATEKEDKTLYARFTAADYDITYELDGGTNGTNPTSYTYGEGVTSFAPATKTGYTFQGWFDKASGGNEVTNISTTATGNKTLYARFEVNDYDITYELDGGTNSAFNPSFYIYGNGVASFESATKTGYTFKGWFDKASGGNEVTNISTTATGNKTLYARFEANDYDITYHLDGGENGSNPATYTYGVGVASFEPATKDGYIFLGWFDKASGGSEITEISDTATGTRTLYAHFKQDHARLEVQPIVKTITRGTTYTWHHPEHNPVLYDEDNNVVPDAELWAIVNGVVYSATDAAELPEGDYDVTFTNVNPNLRFNPFSRLITRAAVREVSVHTRATIIAKDAPVKKPAPITVRYVDQSGKELKTATVYTGQIGDAISSAAPMIEGYELLSLSDKINAMITDQAQTFSFVYKPTNATQPGQQLPTTGQQLPRTGESQHVFNLLLGFILVALVSFLSWVKLGKKFVKETD